MSQADSAERCHACYGFGYVMNSHDGPKMQCPYCHEVRWRWVAQEDAEGCALAVLSMLTGVPYAVVKAEVESYPSHAHRAGRDWNASGTTHYTLDEFLIRRGWYLQRIYKAWEVSEWPPDPWAFQHFASVEQPSGRSHFVFMDAHGAVLDPLREGVYRLSDWPVQNVVGLKR